MSYPHGRYICVIPFDAASGTLTWCKQARSGEYILKTFINNNKIVVEQ